MSDAMSNHDIEDVLSSIRRLVAQENGHAPKNRLVLTPAHRVTQDAASDTNKPLVLAAERRTHPEPGEPPAALAESAPPQPAARPETPPAPDPRALELQRLQETLDKLEIAASAAPATSYKPRQTPPPAAPAPARPVTEATIAPPNEPASAAATAKALAQTSSITDAAAASAAPDQIRADMVMDNQPQDAPLKVPAASSSADPRPAGPAPGLTQPPDDAPAGAPESDGIIETLIDEEMLRALVAQLVREELRGQLGERITLQVRKLVRAEIARALDERQYL
ncbi:MAG: hypothetical protein ACXIVG_00590 [Pararhodobacter sp.]